MEVACHQRISPKNGSLVTEIEDVKTAVLRFQVSGNTNSAAGVDYCSPFSYDLNLLKIQYYNPLYFLHLSVIKH